MSIDTFYSLKQQVPPNMTNTAAARAKRSKEELILIDRALSGDQPAYAILLRRHYGTIYHTMVKMVKNREDAADLTQEAFSKAFHKLANFTPNYAFGTWLYRIAVNNCIDHIRRKKLRMLSIDEPLEAGGDTSFAGFLEAKTRNPEEEVIRDQRLAKMRTLVEQLSPKYRRMIEMRFYRDMSYDEIAKELGLPLGTVKAQLFRAKEMLFRRLQEPGTKAWIELPKQRRKVKRRAPAALLALAE